MLLQPHSPVPELTRWTTLHATLGAFFRAAVISNSNWVLAEDPVRHPRPPWSTVAPF